jgi:hypothetical protein
MLETLHNASSGAWPRVDAAVNHGNCLSELAVLSDPQEAVALLQTAVESYSSAIASEPDALVRRPRLRECTLGSMAPVRL